MCIDASTTHRQPRAKRHLPALAELAHGAGPIAAYLIAIAAILLFPAHQAVAAEPGNIKARFLLAPPTDDDERKGESGPEPLEQVLVQIVGPLSDEQRKAEPQAQRDKREQMRSVKLTVNQGFFDRPVVLMMQGGELAIENVGVDLANVACLGDALQMNALIKRGETKKQICKVATKYPERLESLLSLDRTCFLFVLDNPYVAVSDAKGDAAIDGIPAGRYVLRIWSSRARRALTFGEIRHGKFEIDVRAGETKNLGEIVIPRRLTE